MTVFKVHSPFLRVFSNQTCISKRYSSYNSQLKYTFDDIPGPKSLPVIGTLYHYMPIVGDYDFDKLHINGFKKLKHFGPVIREEIIPGINIIWIFKPEDIETLFRCEGRHPQRRSHLALEKYRTERPHIYNTGGLFATNGPEWFRIRSVFQRGLSSPNSVLSFLPSSAEIIDDWLERIEEIRHESNVDYLPEISRLFLELTCMTTLDLRFNSFSKSELDTNSRSSKLLNAALISNSCILKTDNGLQLWRKMKTPLYKKFCKAQQYMESVAIDVLSLKMSLFKENDVNKSTTLLESYLASPELDFKDIIGMTCDFLLAGMDTSSYTTCYVLYYLARNPEVQNKLYEECKNLLPRRDQHVTKEILEKAQYTKAVLKESLRLRPLSVGIGRVLERDAVFSGYHVPKGTVVVTQNQVSCRFEEYFQDANSFKPERWLKKHESYKSIHPFLSLPFGHGPRSCIARRLAEQNIRTLLIKLLRRFRIGWNGGNLQFKSLLINKPDGPINLVFERRNE